MVDIFRLKESSYVDPQTGEAFCDIYAGCPNSNNCGTKQCTALVYETKISLHRLNIRHPRNDNYYSARF